jgi:hypothetical protein
MSGVSIQDFKRPGWIEESFAIACQKDLPGVVALVEKYRQTAKKQELNEVGGKMYAAWWHGVNAEEIKLPRSGPLMKQCLSLFKWRPEEWEMDLPAFERSKSYKIGVSVVDYRNAKELILASARMKVFPRWWARAQGAYVQECWGEIHEEVGRALWAEAEQSRFSADVLDSRMQESVADTYDVLRHLKSEREQVALARLASKHMAKGVLKAMLVGDAATKTVLHGIERVVCQIGVDKAAIAEVLKDCPDVLNVGKAYPMMWLYAWGLLDHAPVNGKDMRARVMEVVGESELIEIVAGGEVGHCDLLSSSSTMNRKLKESYVELFQWAEQTKLKRLTEVGLGDKLKKLMKAKVL